MVDLWPGLDEEVESDEERSKVSNIARWRCSLNVFDTITSSLHWYNAACPIILGHWYNNIFIGCIDTIQQTIDTYCAIGAHTVAVMKAGWNSTKFWEICKDKIVIKYSWYVNANFDKMLYFYLHLVLVHRPHPQGHPPWKCFQDCPLKPIPS